MIARVLIVAKLPRRFRVFDYCVPASLNVHVGDLVLVPFGNRRLSAVVESLNEHIPNTHHAAIKDIIDIQRAAFLEQQDIDRFKTIAEHIGQSTSTLLYAAFSAISSWTSTAKISTSVHAAKTTGSISKTSLTFLQEALHSTHTCLAVSPEEAIGFITLVQREQKKQTLIIAPRERDVEHIRLHVPFLSAAYITGKTTSHQRGLALEQWRSGELKTLVITRIGSLYRPKNLGAIVVYAAGNDEHRNTRRNPRFDAREAAKLMARQCGVPIFFLDVLPRLADTQTSIPHLSPVTVAGQDRVQVISLRAQEEKTSSIFFSESLLIGIKKALQSQKSVLLFFNRKGSGTRLTCRDCGFSPTCALCGGSLSPNEETLHCVLCGSTIPHTPQCTQCGRMRLRVTRSGTASLAKDIKKFFPEIPIVRCEKGQHPKAYTGIVIATEYFFSSVWAPFFPITFGLIADIDTDLHGIDQTYLSQEHVARHIATCAALAIQQHAECILQTRQPDTLTSCVNSANLYTQEHVDRRAYAVPPYGIQGIFSSSTGLNLPAVIQPYAHTLDDATIIQAEYPLYQKEIAPALSLVPDAFTYIYDGPYCSPNS